MPILYLLLVLMVDCVCDIVGTWRCVDGMYPFFDRDWVCAIYATGSMAMGGSRLRLA